MKKSDPFYSPIHTTKTSIIVHAFHMTFGAMLALIRLPFLIILVILLFLYHYVIQPCLILSQIKRFVSLLINLLLFRLILFTLGFYRIKSDRDFFSKSALVEPPMTRSGFILLCERRSPIDILYLACFYSPQFVKVFYKDDNILLSPLSLVQIFKLAFSLEYQIPNDNHQDIKMKKISTMKVVENSFNEWNGPLALFYEGASVNHYYKIEPQMALLREVQAIRLKYCRHPVAISFFYPDQSYYSPANTATNPLYHLFLLMTNISNSLHIEVRQLITNVLDMGLDSPLLKSKGYQIQSKATWKDYKMFLNSFQKNKVI